MSLFFTTSIEFKAYYDYWVALTALYAKDQARKGNFRPMLNIEIGMIDASIAKAQYRIKTQELK